ncbi:hypothetical protein [Peribacillus frigoritolerans]|nr:hypothetical protein [Peribacillus frigoritolerans]
MLYKKGSQFYLGLHYLDNQLKETHSTIDSIIGPGYGAAQLGYLS